MFFAKIAKKSAHIFRQYKILTMKHLCSLIFLWSAASAVMRAQPTIQWQISLGGSGHDEATPVLPTGDGGYILAGYNTSGDGDVSGNHGDRDFWIVKLDATGTLQWEKSLGGSGDDVAFSIQLASDKGYIAAGRSNSNDGDVSGNHGGLDYWVAKIDSTGALQWQKSYGGSGADYAYFIQTTDDGGYVMAGRTFSNDGDVSGNQGGFDCWLLKLDSAGAIQWQKTLGGSADDVAYAIQPLGDGTYIAAGVTVSNDGDVSGNHGGEDCWVIKLDQAGAIQWQKSLGGSADDGFFDIRPTSDGGYIAAGYAGSNDGDVSGNHGAYDCWVVKLDSAGAMQWQKSLGGSDDEAFRTILPTSDGGYLAPGYSRSADGELTGNLGSNDWWLVKLDSAGAIQWQKSLGGGDSEIAKSILPTSDGGYIATGYSASNDGDVSGNHGGNDMWVVKLNPLSGVEDHMNPANLQIFPNPATYFIEIQTDANDPVAIVHVTDLSGRKLHEQRALKTERIEVSLLPDGVYMVSIVTQSGKRAQKKIVKQ